MSFFVLQIILMFIFNAYLVASKETTVASARSVLQEPSKVEKVVKSSKEEPKPKEEPKKEDLTTSREPSKKSEKTVQKKIDDRRDAKNDVEIEESVNTIFNKGVTNVNESVF
ncbi:unnamed protein product [Caenorhabditis auriculariae]|uniref:Uncharacterized protein n=1 Tax=Caenorhabditis auriculariae TaxID=2777116 RepID=A0A8S1H854_9PELO|nr:unnamed protein product [Caenorhabditis auriculariae]